MRVFKFLPALFGFLTILARAQAAPGYSIEIDLQEQRAYLLRAGRMVLETPISSGRANYRTPTGHFSVIEKDLEHRSSLYGKIVNARGQTVVADADSDMPVPRGGKFVNAPMRYFLRFTGGVGMHAGYLPGYAASHGCVRLPVDRARAFFEAVEVGAPVNVFGTTGTSRVAAAEAPRSNPFTRRFVPNGWW